MVSKTETSKKMTLSLLFFLSWLCLSPASALDVTHILGRHPEMSTFSNYLAQTHLAHDINSLRTVTLLVVANSDIGPLSGKPMDRMKKILSAHVLLDYYDLPKLKHIKGNTASVTTLLHASPINVSVASGSTVMFRSTHDSNPAQLVRLVESKAHRLSILQISSPVIPNGIAEARTPYKHSRRVLAQAPERSNNDHSQSPQQGSQGTPPPQPPPPANAPTHSSHPPQSNAPAPQQQQQHSNVNAPPPSDNESSPSPTSSSGAPQPSSKADSPAPAEDDAELDSPPKGDSPSPSPAADAPSSASTPSGDSPSSAPEDSDSSSDGEKKGKSSAVGITPPPVAAWTAALFIGVILGNLV